LGVIARQAARDDDAVNVGMMLQLLKAYDTKGFAKDCRDLNVTPHVAQSIKRSGDNAIRQTHDKAHGIRGEPTEAEPN
jgi:hypothetical protein